MQKQNMLAQLESNEAVLLMYLSGELMHQDKAEVEQMLQRDAGMRAELERLRELLGSVEAQCAEADRLEALNVEAAVRKTTRAMRRWQASGASRSAMQVRPQAPRQKIVPWWCYPLAAAASVLLALSVWLAYTEPSGQTLEPRVAEAPVWEDAVDNGRLPDVRQAQAFLDGEQIAAAFDPTDQIINDAVENAAMNRIEKRIDSLALIDGEAWN